MSSGGAGNRQAGTGYALAHARPSVSPDLNLRRLVLPACAALGLCAAATADAQPRTVLPTPVAAVMKKHKLSESGLSVYVQDVTGQAPLLTVNAQVPRNPASVMKLVTTLVALNELGPAYRFQTDVYVDQPPASGRVSGDLYLKGGGDPFLVTAAFWRLLKDLRHEGLEHVTGDLVIDGSHFDVPDVYRGDFDGKPHRAYNVPPHAMLVNFFATRFLFFPDKEHKRVRVVLDPPMATLKLDNTIALTAGRCSWRKRKLRLDVDRMGPEPRMRVSGTFPEGCGEFQVLRAVAEPGPYVFGAFKPLWEEMGGRIDGHWRTGTVPATAVRIHRVRSRPLAELIRHMNKFSNNVMTRNLLLALGARVYGAPGTLDKGRRAVADWLLLNDVRAPEVRVDNGSGLSRTGQISALSLVRVLLKSWSMPYMPEFVSSLPLSAMDGTLRKRFRKSDLEGKLHMKTGLLDGVRTIGGYMHTRSGRVLAVASLHNGRGVEHGTGTAVQDALMRWLYEQ